MKKPLYILSVIPVESSTLKKIFEFKKDSIKELLENPGQLRPMGWDLNTLDTARIVEGEYLEVRNGERKLINLYKDGTLILFASADETFLSWGQREGSFKEDPRLNSVAIIELTYNFVDFYKKLIPHFSIKPTSINFRIKIKNAFFNESELYIVPYEVNTFGWLTASTKYPAQKKDMEAVLLCSVDNLINLPAYVAYLIIEKIYLWFGVPINKIPYVSTDEVGKRSINIERIKNPKE